MSDTHYNVTIMEDKGRWYGIAKRDFRGNGRGEVLFTETWEKRKTAEDETRKMMKRLGWKFKGEINEIAHD
jgi:hypothetical protein